MPATRQRTTASIEPEPAAAGPASGAVQDRLAWLVRFDDLMVDARTLPREFQEMLAADGVIPYVSGAGGDGE